MEILNALIDYIKKFGDILFFNTGKGNAEILFAQGNQTDPVFFEQMEAEILRLDLVEAETHKISGIEWIRCPCILEPWI